MDGEEVHRTTGRLFQVAGPDTAKSRQLGPRERQKSLDLSRHRMDDCMWREASSAALRDGITRYNRTQKNSSIYRPVVVEMAELVGQSLHVIRLQLSRVMNHVVVSWCHRSLADTL